jgi:hypothetical protein
MDRYELQKLRDLPIEGVAERLGLRVRMHKALCPFHDDHHASLSFSVRRNTFRCFVCGASGGTIDLVMRCLNKGFRDATKWLADEHNVILTDNRFNGQCSMVNGQSPKPFDAQRYERYFDHLWLNDEARRFLFDERRLDERVVRWCRLTSWRDKQGVSWLQIPYYDREGHLVGVQNRNLVKGAMPRFRFPQGSECGIYNLPVLSLLQPGDALYITEGCSDCWAMLSAGHKAIAIPSATLLKRKDVELLKTLNSQFPAPNSQLPAQPNDACYQGDGRTPDSQRPALPKDACYQGDARTPNSQFPAPNSQFPAQPKDACYQRDGRTPDSQFPAPNSQFSISFHMYPDRDEPGERLFLQLQQVLPGLVHHQLPVGCKDFSDYYLQVKGECR